MPEEDQGTQPEPQADTAESVQADQTPPQEPAAPAQSQGPWAADLEAAFDDPNQRAAVDKFLRENVQPHVTQLEQAQAPNKAAERLYSDFTESPVDTYYSVTQELFGDEAAEAVKAALASDENAPDADDDVYGEDDDDGPDLSALPPQAREAIEYVQDQRAAQEYEAELDKIRADKPDLNLDPDLFSPFVMAAEGDLEVAVENYEQFLSRFGEQKEEVETPQAPPTVGQDRTGGSTPPVQKRYGSLDEALDAMFNEEKRPPTTVGEV